jgi:hypothetical protein
MKEFERNAQYVEAERARQQLEGLRKQYVSLPYLTTPLTYP